MIWLFYLIVILFCCRIRKLTKELNLKLDWGIGRGSAPNGVRKVDAIKYKKKFNIQLFLKKKKVFNLSTGNCWYPLKGTNWYLLFKSRHSGSPPPPPPPPPHPLPHRSCPRVIGTAKSTSCRCFNQRVVKIL